MSTSHHPQMVYHFWMAAFAPEADRIVRQLRDEIIEGVRSPGSRLVERDLAAEMGVSRVPVRDALKALVAEGLATPRPRTWTMVREFSDADVDDLIEVRSALETLAFRLAAVRRTDAQLAQLGAQLDREHRAARIGDARAARRAGADFHETVVSMAANRLLSELFAGTRSRMRWLLGQHSELQLMADEHSALHRALVDRDLGGVALLAESHLVTSREAAQRHRHAEFSRDSSARAAVVPGE